MALQGYSMALTSMRPVLAKDGSAASLCAGLTRTVASASNKAAAT
jgi:hypothetical protein